MKQWVIPADVTDPAGLKVENVAVPEPGPGQVRVRVTALSLNARDGLILSGPFGRLPGSDLVPLSDLAGVVDSVGADVTAWQVGDRVTRGHAPNWVSGRPVPFGIGSGSLDDPGAAAEYVILDAGTLVAAPAHLDDAEASTLQVAGVTAWNALFGANPVTAGDRVLVIGSGGVALYALQLAQAVGAEVYVALRSRHDDPRWKDLDVAGIVDTTESGWGEHVKALSGGITKVVNTVGWGILNECLAALEPGGEQAVLGLYDPAPQAPDTMLLTANQLSVRGVAVGSVAMHRELAQFMAHHDLHPLISEHVAFDRLPDAFTVLRDGAVFGKLVIDL
ncbi:NAD(P)-dependent alcohol dehydrogenase [Micromonospora sp. WP24]|uniref:zinc-dependent alcohol dehydrogenase family protein n=1 Tax=Micromonospora sp. WP24 TaxID=2604469 RepID=UPI0011D3B42F|nr:NAD(P)-dependent alcohol dehydrogenase [Micromonospora sp. WP24]TYC01212.1 NAD(P)-dependent alcohol dehydrogenase [Micromonospora sp. WP24]